MAKKFRSLKAASVWLQDVIKADGVAWTEGQKALVKDSAERIEEDYRGAIEASGATFSYELRNSVATKIKPLQDGTAVSVRPYSKYVYAQSTGRSANALSGKAKREKRRLEKVFGSVEFASLGRKAIPVTAELRAWAAAKGIGVWALAYSVYQRGFPGKRFIQRARELTRKSVPELAQQMVAKFIKDHDRAAS